jgi:hypothetical protein
MQLDGGVEPAGNWHPELVDDPYDEDLPELVLDDDELLCAHRGWQYAVLRTCFKLFSHRR